MRRFLLPALIITAVLITAVLASASGAQARKASTNLNLVAFSTPKPLMGVLINRFQHQPQGQGVTFTQSYGPSGSQAKAIVAGQPADIAFLSNGLDVDTIADAGLVSKTWTNAPQGGIAANSVVSFVVRPGNPLGIHTWKDLTKPGVKVVTPDPFPSGGAKWNVLAAYGQARKSGMSNKKAIAWVTKLFKNVVAQPTSASAAASAFFGGEGDVLITYESEAYSAFAAGKQGKLVVPKPTMLIQLPMVALKSAPAAATAFIKYVHSPKQQKIIAANGYRPVIKSVMKSPDLASWKKKYNTGPTFKITDKLFGGWRKANTVWFDPAHGKMLKIEQAVGGPTS